MNEKLKYDENKIKITKRLTMHAPQGVFFVFIFIDKLFLFSGQPSYPPPSLLVAGSKHYGLRAGLRAARKGLGRKRFGVSDVLR